VANNEGYVKEDVPNGEVNTHSEKRKTYRVLVWRSKHLGRIQVRCERNIKICMLKFGRAWN